jgi:hypothetical protein
LRLLQRNILLPPGEILPTRELYAEMLIEQGKYKKSLIRSPNRFNSLYGVGRAAELGGDKKKAAYYYGKLKETTAESSKESARLRQVLAFFNN